MIRKWTSSGGKERCVRDYARRRVSERNRRKAALGAEITQEGETGDAPPVEISATERKGVRGKPKKGFLRH